MTLQIALPSAVLCGKNAAVTKKNRVKKNTRTKIKRDRISLECRSIHSCSQLNRFHNNNVVFVRNVSIKRFNLKQVVEFPIACYFCVHSAWIIHFPKRFNVQCCTKPSVDADDWIWIAVSIVRTAVHGRWTWLSEGSNTVWGKNDYILFAEWLKYDVFGVGRGFIRVTSIYKLRTKCVYIAERYGYLEHLSKRIIVRDCCSVVCVQIFDAF